MTQEAPRYCMEPVEERVALLGDGKGRAYCGLPLPCDVHAPRCQVVVGETTLSACDLPMARNLAGVGVFVCPVHGAPDRGEA